MLVIIWRKQITTTIVAILVLFNAKKSDECENEDMIAVAGCNVSLIWSLRTTIYDFLAFSIFSSFEGRIATLSSDENCIVRDSSTMFCNMNVSDDGLIVVLNMFNVTAGHSGNYTLWKRPLWREQLSNTSKKLVIIGKPTIMEVRKPIFGLPFQMTCNITNEQEHLLYRWRINDIESTTVYNVNSYTISSLGMIDTFSNVTCKVCLNQKASNLSCVTCQNDGCSRYSDPYTIEVPYGPDNVSLSREERHFYLKEYETFEIDCFANCYPNCIFWWKGRDTIESQKLNIFFEPKMSGQYACYVTNKQTNFTIISDPITLHYVKEVSDFQRDNNWLGTVIICVFILIVGLLIVVTIWRTNTTKTRTIDSGKLSQVCVQTQTEVSQTELERHNKHLHIPSTKAREYKTTMRLVCPKHSPEDNIRPKLLEDHYNTIDNDVLSDDELGMDLLIHNNSHETRRNNEHLHYDYAQSTGIRHMETAIMHVADDTLLTTSSDFDCTIEIFQDEGNKVHGTDHSYLTVIDDSVHSIEVHQVHETDVNGLDKTSITPLNG